MKEKKQQQLWIEMQNQTTNHYLECNEKVEEKKAPSAPKIELELHQIERNKEAEVTPSFYFIVWRIATILSYISILLFFVFELDGAFWSAVYSD